MAVFNSLRTDVPSPEQEVEGIPVPLRALQRVHGQRRLQGNGGEQEEDNVHEMRPPICADVLEHIVSLRLAATPPWLNQHSNNCHAHDQPESYHFEDFSGIHMNPISTRRNAPHAGTLLISSRTERIDCLDLIVLIVSASSMILRPVGEIVPNGRPFKSMLTFSSEIIQHRLLKLVVGVW